MSDPRVTDPRSAQGEIRRVAGHTATYAIAVFAGGLGRVFLIPIVTRFLTADEYGVVALVLAFVSLVGILMDLGLASSLIKFYSEAADPNLRRRVVSTLFAGGAASGVLIALVLVPGGRLFSQLLFKRGDYVHFVHLGLALGLASALFRIALSYYQAVPAPVRYAAVSVVKGALAVAGAAVFVMGLGWGPAGYLVGAIVPPAVLSVAVMPGILRSVGLGFDPRSLRRGLRFGVPLVPATFAMWGLTYCDIYLLGRLATLEQVGWYQLGQEICMGMGLFVSAVQLAWPRFIFSHAREPGAPKTFALSAAYYIMGLSVVGLGIAVFAEEIILVIGSRAYVPAAGVIPLLCLSTLLFALYGLFASGVQIAGRTEFMAMTTACGLGVNVALNLWMIPRWGMAGAAAASVLSNAGMCVVILSISKRFYEIPFSAPRIAGVTGLAVGLFVVSLWAEGLPALRWVLLAKGGVVAALVGAVLFGFFSREETEKVRALVRDLFQRGA